jgi:hypothetical protein
MMEQIEMMEQTEMRDQVERELYAELREVWKVE